MLGYIIGLDVMQHFAHHASHCPRCEDAFRVYVNGDTLCDRGHAYARDIAQYVYSKAADQGLKIRSQKLSTVVSHDRRYPVPELERRDSYDVVEVAPRRREERKRVKVIYVVQTVFLTSVRSP